jgi:broad specificity phosphatase PhoE
MDIANYEEQKELGLPQQKQDNQFTNMMQTAGAVFLFGALGRVGDKAGAAMMAKRYADDNPMMFATAMSNAKTEAMATGRYNLNRLNELENSVYGYYQKAYNTPGNLTSDQKLAVSHIVDNMNYFRNQMNVAGENFKPYWDKKLREIQGQLDDIMTDPNAAIVYNNKITEPIVEHLRSLIPEDERAITDNRFNGVIARHAQTNMNAQGKFNNDDTPLNDEGKKQAKDLGTQLQAQGVTQIITSPSVRSVETAVAIGLPHATSAMLNEWNTGTGGGAVSSFDMKYYVDHPDEKPEGGESFNDFLGRVQALRKRASELDGETGLVTHGLTMKLWEALDKSGGKWDEVAKTEFLKDSNDFENTEMYNPASGRVEIKGDEGGTKQENVGEVIQPQQKGLYEVGEGMAGEQFPTKEQVYDWIESEESRQGGSLIDNEYGDARFESEEQAKQYADEVHSFLESVADKDLIPVYRAVSAEDVDLSPYGIGESWSFDLNAAKEFAKHLGVPTSKVKIISGLVPKENVDWEQAVRNYHNFSDAHSGESEFELPIPANRKIKNVTISDYKSAKEIQLEENKQPNIIEQPINKEQTRQEKINDLLDRTDQPDKQSAEETAGEGKKEPGGDTEDSERQPKTNEQKAIAEQLQAAREELATATDAFKNKRRELDKDIRDDQADLFGERKSQQESKLFDERVDVAARDKALQPFKDRMEKAKAEIDRLEAKQKEYADKGTSQRNLLDAIEEEKSMASEKEHSYFEKRKAVVEKYGKDVDQIIKELKDDERLKIDCPPGTTKRRISLKNIISRKK